MHGEKLLPEPVRILGFARRPKTDESWRAELFGELQKYSRTQPVDPARWAAFAANLGYCQGDLSDPELYRRRAARLNALSPAELGRNRLFYLATSHALRSGGWPAMPGRRSRVFLSPRASHPQVPRLTDARIRDRAHSAGWGLL